MPPIEALFSISTLLFLAFAGGALATAIAMVLHPNPVRAALFLVLNLFCVAVLYLLLNAYFLAAVQVIVYAGAIMVLFLFVIMLLNLGSPDRTTDRLRWQQPVGVLAGLALAAVFGGVIFASVPYNNPATVSLVSTTLPTAENAAPVETNANTSLAPDTMGTADGIGKTLYNPALPYLFPFEATSVLLLIATIGSVVLAKRRVPGDEEGMA